LSFIVGVLGLAPAPKLGYTRFNAGTTVKVRSDIARGAALAKRIVRKVEMGLQIRAAPSKRDRVLLRGDLCPWRSSS
jgi:hypothetical protein